MKKLNWFQYFVRSLGGISRYHQDGVRIRQVNRDAYKYFEYDHSLLFVAEWLGNEYAISSAPINHWLPPFEHEVITNEDKQRIMKNISNFFDYYGYKHFIDNK